MSKLDEAIRYAVEVHAGMVRKGEEVPYILHPLEVATIAATMTTDEDVLCAAVLHDVVEDTSASMEDVEQRFGARVAQLVASETENKRDGMPRHETWRVRKEESLRKLRDTTDRDVRILWLSDKLANMRSMSRLHEQMGDALWELFNQRDVAQQAWYYASIASALEDLSDTAAWREYDRLRGQVFEGRYS